MYKIIKTDNTILGYTGRLQFIKLSASNCFVEATGQDALGIAFDGVVYNLIGHDEIEGASEVMAIEIDEGKIAFDNEARIAKTEDATCESDTMNDKRMTETENALCELDKEASNG